MIYPTQGQTDQAPELEEERTTTQRETVQNAAPSSDAAAPVRRCTNTSCPLTDEVPQMERVWVELMSPVPKPNQTIRPSFTPGAVQPDEGRFSQIIEALRPPGVDDHALETIREAWIDVVEDHLSEMPARLKLKLAELSQTWVGDDFDQFSEQVETARKNLLDTLDEIGEATSELAQLEAQIYAAQGGGDEVPFPLPGVWKASDGVVDGPKIHIRPVWYAGDDCDKDRSEADRWEALGYPRDFGDQIDDWLGQRTAWYVENHDMNPLEAGARAEEDLEAQLGSDVDHWSDTMAGYTQEHNDAIVSRRDQVMNSQGEPALNHEQRTGPTTTDSDVDFAAPDLSGAPSPQTPPLGGHEGFNPPAPHAAPQLSSPQADWQGSQYKPTDLGGSTGGSSLPGSNLPGSGGVGSGGSNWTADDSPWGSPSDDDELGGGLASGGGLGAPGGGLPGGGGGVGAPGGVGAGGGGIGGAVVGAPGAVGAGGGTRGGAGAAGAGRGAAGGAKGAGPGRGAGRVGPGGMMGGGRGAGAAENEEGRETWLTEDEDVWGIGNEEDDPYA